MSSMRDRLMKQFQELVGERVKKISASLMSLEGSANPEAGRASLRELHGLKGEARMMGFAAVNTLVHQMEELVKAAEPSGYRLTGGSLDALLAALDAVGLLTGAVEAQPESAPPDADKLVEWLKQRTQAEAVSKAPPATSPSPSAVAPVSAAPKASAPPATAPPPSLLGAALTAVLESGRKPASGAAAPPALPPTPSVPESPSDNVAPPAASTPTPSPAFEPLAPVRNAAPPPRTEARSDSVRVRQEVLEDLTTAVTNLNQLARRRELAAARRLALSRELTAIARTVEDMGSAGASLSTRLNRAKELAASLHREAKLFANEELRDLRQITEQVQTMRMLPLSVLFEPFPRMARDLAKELAKEVELVVSGGETQADRSVVESLRDPLMHLIRNAIDHGVERPEVRTAAGKPARGKIELSASREGGRILIRVSDDGGGLDSDLLRKVAVRRGLLEDATAATLSEQHARELIFLPGFSSKDHATDISGRGVGMDVVQVRIQSLGGDVAFSSVVGKGTAFELRVPVSLTVAPLLFIEVGTERICLPASYVSQAVRVQAEQIREVAGRPALKVSDEVLPFLSLASVLGQGTERPAQSGELVLLVKGQSSTAAVSVDRVLEERVQAVLPLKGVLSRFNHLAGATPIADGSLAMVLSATHLVAVAQGSTATLHTPRVGSTTEQERKRRIMVVDDSPLTRELISSLLEAVGYDVVNAQDGAEALERLPKVDVDMVVTDLEMPRMDGLELTRKLKSHPVLRTLPVVIVTTRGGDTDRRRGMEAGADGYIAKGDLVRQDLVDVVSRLLS